MVKYTLNHSNVFRVAEDFSGKRQRNFQRLHKALERTLKTIGGIPMKNGYYYLIENDNILHKSMSLQKLINYTTETKNAEIYFNGVLIWVQNTNRYYGG